jgi:23S rRNA pseudouridine2605 synthase
MNHTRLNKLIALRLGVSRREADELISAGLVEIAGSTAELGQKVDPAQKITVKGQLLPHAIEFIYLALNKPVNYVCSRRQQGDTPTVYSLLPPEYQQLKLVGRLDRDSSGLILLTNDGDFAHRMTHPSFQKQKIYQVELNKPLSEDDFRKITETGVDVGEERLSKFQLVASSKEYVVSKNAEALPHYFLPATYYWRAALTEGRNRQIRRTFEALGYHVKKLHRTEFGDFSLSGLKSSGYRVILPVELE